MCHPKGQCAGEDGDAEYVAVFELEGTDGGTAECCVGGMLAAGYRLIGAVQAQMGERGVGAVIAKSGAARDVIFPVGEVRAGDCGEGKARDSAKQSFQLLDQARQ